MRKLAVLTFVTLDGVMQSPSGPDEDPSNGFKLGGWAAPYWEGVMEQVSRHAISEPYDMVFGRKTFDMFASHWPNAPKSALSDRMNAARKYVVTSKPDNLGWNNAQSVSGDVAVKVRALKESSGPLLQVHGSSQLIPELLAQRLIDEFRLWVFPVVVGGGKRLFERESPSVQMELTAVEPSGNGATMMIYRAKAEAARGQ